MNPEHPIADARRVAQELREADAALAQDAANEGGPIIDDPAALVRHLRNALEAERDEALGLVSILEAERAALAEANTAIERVKALADHLGRCGCDLLTPHREGCDVSAAIRIRRALKGEP